MSKKRKKVPEVLWRLFRHRVQPLLHAIPSMLPPAPPGTSQCRWCNGSQCLSCIRRAGDEELISFLLRSNDPSDYRNLLNNCFAVVDHDNALPLSDDFSPRSHWTQRQIILKTIDMVQSENLMEANAICGDYDKCNHSSSIVELLSCSAWCLLLERVGDSVMFCLLKSASIFLPFPGKKHYQVAGPLIRLNNKMRENTSFLQSGYRKRRKVGDTRISLSREENNISYADNNLASVIETSHSNCSQLKQNNSTIKDSAAFFIEAVLKEQGGLNADRVLNGVLQVNSDQIAPLFRLHRRPFRWQRHRKRRKINSQETGALIPHGPFTNDGDTLHRNLCNSNSSSDFPFNKMPLLCSCCMLLSATKKLAKRAHIQRRQMFYNLDSYSLVFPKKHILNSLKPNFAGSISLIKDIFNLSEVDLNIQTAKCFHSCGFCLSGSTCPFHSIVKLMKSLIRKTRCCQHVRLIHKHCIHPLLVQDTYGSALNSLQGNINNGKSSKKPTGDCCIDFKDHLEALGTGSKDIELYCKKSQVVSFIWAVCRSIIPPELLGAPGNWRILRKNIYRFIELRRFEKFSLRQCLHKLKASGFPFFTNQLPFSTNDWMLHDRTQQNVGIYGGPHELKTMMSNLRNILLEKWIYWFFSCIVVPIVKANFYVTESEHGKQEIYYYHKAIWEKLSSREMSRLEGQTYSCLDDATVRKILSRRSFGFSKLRFCPKERGLRSLANLKASSSLPLQPSFSDDQYLKKKKKIQSHRGGNKYKNFRPVNFVLRDAHAVLKGLKLEDPELLGSSVFDYNDVYRKLCSFLLSLKNGSGSVPDIFIVVSDVVKAFDSVYQDHLISIMKNMLVKCTYHLQESREIIYQNNVLHFHDILNFTHQNSDITPGGLLNPVSFHSPHSVIINKVSRRLKGEELFFNLKEHVKRNVLQFGKKYYIQIVGIPQGSVLSAMLCSFYFGNMERDVIFPFLEKAHAAITNELSTKENSHENSGCNHSKKGENHPCPQFLLLRFIDDYLLISNSKAQAVNFFSRLKRGFRDYNCHMNKEKFGVNFDVGEASEQHRVYVGKDGNSFFRWSGLLINSRTLEVQGDYGRYINHHLNSTLTINWSGRPGLHLKSKLYAFLRPKCHPIFFDSNINSAGIVRLNIFQIFLLCAMKFHCYVRGLSRMCKINARCYFRSIGRSIRYMHALINKRMRALCVDWRLFLQLEKEEVEWLGLVAFIQVLRRKQSRHKELLSLLKAKLLQQEVAGSLSSSLKYAVEPSHSSLLWKVKY